MIGVKVATRIERIAKNTIRKGETRDPYVLAKRLGVCVDFAEHPELLGFSSVVLRNTFIGLNSSADEYTCRCACAHELGHVVLRHLRAGGSAVRYANDLSNMSSRYEAEANCFAATLLMDDEDVLEAIALYGDPQKAAASLYVCPELYQAKIRLLQLKGCDLPLPDLERSKSWRGYMPD